MTGFSGLPLYMDLANAVGLPKLIKSHLRICSEDQGWTDNQIVKSLILLNLSGGESISDLEVLNADIGLSKLLRSSEDRGLNSRQKHRQSKRFRQGRKRALPSASVVRRYLENFHSDAAEASRQPHQAFIPEANHWLKKLYQINWELVSTIQKYHPKKIATLDGDATLIETHKSSATYCYKKHKAYQPFNLYWFEHGLLVHSEFRDGNVPAGFDQTRLLQEALDHLPKSVEKVYHRSDTAGYQKELLRYCHEGKHKRFKVIDYAIGVKVSQSFKQAVSELKESDWKPIYKGRGADRYKTNQEYAEVCYVPSWLSHKKPKKDEIPYRFIAIREPFVKQEILEGMEPKQQELPFQTIDLSSDKSYKLFGVVTNRTIDGNDLIEWYRERGGKSEEIHAVEKTDLAGGRLPSNLFGANAAWWGIMILACNLNTVMQRQILGESFRYKRFKALRYWLICIAGRVITQARQLIIKISAKHPAFEILTKARQRILAMMNGPPTHQLT